MKSTLHKMTPEQFKALLVSLCAVFKYRIHENDSYQKQFESGWNIGEGSFGATLKSENGEGGIHVSVGGYRLEGRIQISGFWPRDVKGHVNIPYKTTPPEITVASSRTTDSVAKDIMTRFMPRYREALHEVLQRNRSVAEYEGMTAKTAMLLASVAPLQKHQYSENSYYVSLNKVRDIRINGDEVHLTINNLTPAQAMDILGRLVAYENAEEKGGE